MHSILIKIKKSALNDARAYQVFGSDCVIGSFELNEFCYHISVITTQKIAVCDVKSY